MVDFVGVDLMGSVSTDLSGKWGLVVFVVLVWTLLGCISLNEGYVLISGCGVMLTESSCINVPGIKGDFGDCSCDEAVAFMRLAARGVSSRSRRDESLLEAWDANERVCR